MFCYRSITDAITESISLHDVEMSHLVGIPMRSLPNDILTVTSHVNVSRHQLCKRRETSVEEQVEVNGRICCQGVTPTSRIYGSFNPTTKYISSGTQIAVEQQRISSSKNVVGLKTGIFLSADVKVFVIMTFCYIMVRACPHVTVQARRQQIFASPLS